MLYLTLFWFCIQESKEDPVDSDVSFANFSLKKPDMSLNLKSNITFSFIQAEDEGDDADDAEDGADSDKEDHIDDPVAEVDSDVKVRIFFSTEFFESINFLPCLLLLMFSFLFVISTG